MINGNYQDFIHKISYGDEVWFVYKDKKYFIQGMKENNIYKLLLDIPYSNLKEYVWVGKGDEYNYPVDDFLSAPIFDGKSFNEIESQIEWVN